MREETEVHGSVASSEENKLYMHTFKGEWEQVMELYRTKPWVWMIEITSSKDTALHMAINEDREDIVEKLVGIIMADKADDNREDIKKALSFANEGGDTLLHRAAARGSKKMCECILEAGNHIRDPHFDLLGIRNKWGETPIFVAALHNRKLAFLSLLKAFDKKHHGSPESREFLRRTVGGDTVLHAAIRREHYDLAFHIIHACSDLLGKFNVKGMTPLHVLASKSPAFRSGHHLSWWEAIIYYCIHVDPLIYDPHHDPNQSTSQTSSEQMHCPENYLTCFQFPTRLCSVLKQFFLQMWRGNKSSCSEGDQTDKGDPENPNVPKNFATCYEFLAFLYLNLSGVAGFAKTFTDINKAKQKHKWSVQILDELMKRTGAYTKGGSDPGSDIAEFDERPNLFDITKAHDKKGTDDKAAAQKTDTAKKTDTALVVAAQKGVIEVVNKILSQLPVSIHDTSSMNKNVLLVAVESRQTGIMEALEKHLTKVSKRKLWEDLVQAVDAEDNTILHLAAKYDDSSSHPWQIQGSAMQMQWEIKWYEYVKKLAPPHFVFLSNNNDETPGQIFTRNHKELVERSSTWLKDTSESCSVVAALVAGVSFATSSTVPGGNDENTGKPKLEGQPAFELFAITALIGLCFSVTALIMFLSILTSRKQPKDFKKNLPLKLLLGLSSLFVSIASMLISFCAAHFFVLEDQFKNAVFALYAATCLPVSFYAIAQFPLYLDLLKAIVTTVPQSHHFGQL